MREAFEALFITNLNFLSKGKSLYLSFGILVVEIRRYEPDHPAMKNIM